MQTWLDGDLPPRLISREKLNELYARGKRVQIFASLEEFTTYIKDQLGLDILEPRMLTEEQGRDLEAMIFNRERQSA